MNENYIVKSNRSMEQEGGRWHYEYARCRSVISSNPKYNADYLNHIIRTKWLKILNEKEKEADEICTYQHPSEVV